MVFLILFISKRKIKTNSCISVKQKIDAKDWWTIDFWAISFYIYSFIFLIEECTNKWENVPSGMRFKNTRWYYSHWYGLSVQKERRNTLGLEVQNTGTVIFRSVKEDHVKYFLILVSVPGFWRISVPRPLIYSDISTSVVMEENFPQKEIWSTKCGKFTASSMSLKAYTRELIHVNDSYHSRENLSS